MSTGIDTITSGIGKVTGLGGVQGQDLEAPAATTGNKGASTPTTDAPNPGHIQQNGKKPPTTSAADILKAASQGVYGQSAIGVKKPREELNKDDNAVKSVKDKHTEDNKGKPTEPKNPTAGASVAAKIHDALMEVDPGQIAAPLKMALQSMNMIRMMDNMTSPAGILAMASGGIGGALGGLAGAVGLGGVQNALNGAMGGLSAIAGVTSTMQNALQGGMMGMISGAAQGVFDPAELAQTIESASILHTAMNEIAVGSAYAIDAVAQFGGPAFGLTPGSLEANIALLGPGGQMTYTQIINGVRVNTYIQTSSIPMNNWNMPNLNGLEHVAIAAGAISNIAGSLSGLIGVDNPIGGALGQASDALGDVADVAAIAGGVGNIGSMVGGLMQGGPASIAGGLALAGTAANVLGGAAAALSADGLAGALSNGIGGIVDGGLNKILGVTGGLNGLLGNVTSLLPNMAGNIQSLVAQIPNVGLPSAIIIENQLQKIKALALSKTAANAARNIFEAPQAAAIGELVGMTAGLASAVGSFKAMTPFGDIVHSVAAGVAIGEVAGSAIGSIAQGIGGITFRG
jgi:hypothetical protein